MKNLVVTKIVDNAILPSRKYFDDAGLDLYSLGPVIIKRGETKVVRTGIAMAIPSGWFGLLKPKGRHDFLIGAGVVDAGYRGEILVKIVNTTDHDISFLAGDPLAQIVILPCWTMPFEQWSVEAFEKAYILQTDRGSTGGIHNS